MFKRAVFMSTAFALMAYAPFAQETPAPPTASTPAAETAAAGPVQAFSGGGQAYEGGVIQLQVGKSHVLKDVKTFEITNPSVVDAQPTPEGDLILNAKGPGSTTVMVQKSGALGYFKYDVEVVGVDVENVMKVIKAALGGIVGLQITQEGNVVVLQGEVASRDDGMRIDRQKGMFGNTILDLTKRTYMQDGLILLKDELGKSQFRDISTETRLNAKGDEVLMLRGTVYSDEQKAQLLDIAGRFFEADRIVDQIRIESPQVEVDIEVYSFDMGRLRSLGDNTLLSQISHLTADGWIFQTGPRIDIEANSPRADIDAAAVNKHTIHYPLVTLGADVDQVLDASNTINAASNVSRQHASVRSGQAAKVDNIREDNIRIATGFAADLKQVTSGQTLTIQPTVVDDKRFETNVTIELSNITSAVPGTDSAISVARRSLNSVFVSEQGQTIVLGGNKRVGSLKSEDSTPFLAHVPIVNWWFRDKINNNDETVQVFLMTLVAPEVMAAQEEAQSKAAMGVKSRTTNNVDTNTEFLKKRQRWEAEGIHTLMTGESKFE